MKSDVWTNFVQTFDITVKALTMISNSLHHRYFQMKTDMNVKIGSYTKLCMQKKILAPKMQNIKQQDFRFRTSYLEKVDCKFACSPISGIFVQIILPSLSALSFSSCPLICINLPVLLSLAMSEQSPFKLHR